MFSWFDYEELLQNEQTGCIPRARRHGDFISRIVRAGLETFRLLLRGALEAMSTGIEDDGA